MSIGKEFGMQNSFSLLFLLELRLAWATFIWYRQRTTKIQYVIGDLDPPNTGFVFETFTIVNAWKELERSCGKNIPDETFLWKICWQHIWTSWFEKMLVVIVNVSSHFIYLFLINLFILFILFLAVLCLVFCKRAFSSCRERASHGGGFSCCRAQALGMWASVVVAQGLSSCGSQPQ